ncbi:hypothetical protein OJAV_G00058180, partial [Oryzias javanicus]
VSLKLQRSLDVHIEAVKIFIVRIEICCKKQLQVMEKHSAMDIPRNTDASRPTQKHKKTRNNKQTKEVVRKLKCEKKKQKKRLRLQETLESPEPAPTQTSTSTQDNTPVRGLKRKRQEDKQEEEIIEPKKRRVCLKAHQSSKTFSDHQTRSVKRKAKPEPKKKNKKVKHCKPTESPETDISQDNTPVRGLKRKRLEDEEEEEILEPKKRKTGLKAHQSSKTIFDDQTRSVERKPKPEPKKKNKKVKHCKPTESPETDISQKNTPVRGLKRKRLEDEEEEATEESKIMKLSFKSFHELRDLYNKMGTNKTSGPEKTVLNSSENENESNQEIPENTNKMTERDNVIDQKAEFEEKR